MARPDDYGEACYEVWRRGYNPDNLDRDRAADAFGRGCSPDDVAEAHCERIAERRREQQAEENAAMQAEHERQQDEANEAAYAEYLQEQGHREPDCEPEG